MNNVKETTKNNKLMCLTKNHLIALLNFFKTYRFVFLLLLIFLVPFYLQLNVFGFSSWLKKLIRIGTPRDWLGFWSSYLGSLVSIGFAYFNTKYQVNNKARKSDYKILKELEKINDKYELCLNNFLTRSKTLKNTEEKLYFYVDEEKLINEYSDKYIEYSNDFYEKYIQLMDIKTSNNILAAFRDFKKASDKIINIHPGIILNPTIKNEHANRINEDFNTCCKKFEEIKNNIGKVISKIET